MFSFILNILLVTKVFSLDTSELETKNFNEKSQLLDNQYPPVSRQIDFDDLKNIMENSFTDNEKIEKFSVVDGFYKDFYYLKNLNNNLSLKSFNMLKQWAKKNQTTIPKIYLPNNKKLTPDNLDDSIKERLILEAQRARTFAYAPYSEFHVGAAILTKDGYIYSAANFENAAYGNTICAERCAIAKAISSENRGVSFQQNADIVAIAIVIRGGGGSPCGNCRQALNEFNPDMLVIMSDIDAENIIEKHLYELLPMGFGPANLDKAKALE
ncbi:MAG: Cytidine deaminase [Candidatus Anoxychlamydiales bacterium]|nr:Cytidine deaminase [Candidatus Anoxychlamydiales bacterium]